MNTLQTLWVMWQNEKSRAYYHIGTLNYLNEIYEFSYTNDGKRKLNEALADGYFLHPSFPEKHTIYQSNALFAAFKRRIPTKDRSDYFSILKDLNLEENCSMMDLLKATRGRLASDMYSFEQPIEFKNNSISLDFYIHGVRHTLSDVPNWYQKIQVGEQILLKQEPTNKFDKTAVAMYTSGGLKLGYVPAVYSEQIFNLLETGASTDVKITYINEKSEPAWWLKVKCKCSLQVKRSLPRQTNTVNV